jgi:hypothetical protein
LDISGSRSEVLGSFGSALLEKDGNQLDQLCEKRRSTINRGNANLIDYILRRNYLKHVTDGIIEERRDGDTRLKT